MVNESCVVPKCGNNRRNCTGVSFFVCPSKEKEIIRKWSKFLNIDSINNRICVCSDHFKPDCFERDLKSELLNLKPKRLLKKDAIPTILPKYKKDHIPKTSNSEPKRTKVEKSSKDDDLTSNNIPDEVFREAGSDQYVVLVKPETVLYNNSEEEDDQSESEASCTDEIIITTNISEKAPPTMCRLCLSKEDIMCFLFAEDEKSKNVLKKIEAVLQFKIRYSSNWPSMICIHCYAKINNTNKFIASSKANQITLFTRFGASDEVSKELKVENRAQQIPIEFIDVSTKIKQEPLVLEPLEIPKIASQQLMTPKPESFVKEVESNSTEISPDEESQIILNTKNQTVNVLQPSRSQYLNKARVMSFEESVVWKTDLLVCKFCSLPPFNFFEDYKNHVMFAHDKDEPFICCGFECNNSADLCSHINFAKHRLTKSPLDCNFCGEKFDLVDEFMAHKKEHLRCDICGVVSTDERSSRMHRRDHKTVKEEFAGCEFCDFIAENPRRLDSHKRKAHPDIYVFSCKTCGYRFCDEDELRMHLYSVHGIGDRPRKKYQRKRRNPSFKNIPVDCFICGKQYKNNDSLQMHMSRIHKKRDPAKLTCPHCSKVCLRPETLREHIATHTGELLYKCRFCSKQFKTMVARSIHTRKEHPEEVEKEKEEKRKLNEEYYKAGTTYSVG